MRQGKQQKANIDMNQMFKLFETDIKANILKMFGESQRDSTAGKSCI